MKKMKKKEEFSIKNWSEKEVKNKSSKIMNLKWKMRPGEQCLIRKVFLGELWKLSFEDACVGVNNSVKLSSLFCFE